jgi:hypothetical protein
MCKWVQGPRVFVCGGWQGGWGRWAVGCREKVGGVQEGGVMGRLRPPMMTGGLLPPSVNPRPRAYGVMMMGRVGTRLSRTHNAPTAHAPAYNVHMYAMYAPVYSPPFSRPGALWFPCGSGPPAPPVCRL